MASNLIKNPKFEQVGDDWTLEDCWLVLGGALVWALDVGSYAFPSTTKPLIAGKMYDLGFTSNNTDTDGGPDFEIYLGGRLVLSWSEDVDYLIGNMLPVSCGSVPGQGLVIKQSGDHVAASIALDNWLLYEREHDDGALGLEFI
jgi:hypothetical protein